MSPASVSGALNVAFEQAVVFEQVRVWRTVNGEKRFLLRDVDWSVGSGEQWGIVGPNGAGKTTLLRIASAQMRPSSGSATILGGRLGRTPMHGLRRRIGLVDVSLARRFYPEQRVIDVVLTGVAGAILLTDEPGSDEIERARSLLDAFGVGALAERIFASCSEGERARVMLARALLAEPELLVLDEPASGLDLGARELLLASIEAIAGGRSALTTLTVTHHFEELPASTTHLLLLEAGEVVASGRIAETATDENLSICFGTPLRVEHSEGRVHVRAAGPTRS
jgi:iron complex transport system ATP-binding protein